MRLHKDNSWVSKIKGGLFPCWTDQQHGFLEEIHMYKSKVCVAWP